MALVLVLASVCGGAWLAEFPAIVDESIGVFVARFELASRLFCVVIFIHGFMPLADKALASV